MTVISSIAESHMKRQQYPKLRWRRIRLLGRVGFALASGGAFAALSWDSRPTEGTPTDVKEKRGDLRTAERQSIVREDDALPQIRMGRAGLRGDAPWAIAQTRHRSDRWADRDGSVYITDDQTTNGLVPSGQTGKIKTMTTAVANPRGPP